MKTLSREQKIYLALWRKADTMEEPLSITLSSPNEAKAMRLGMYRVIKPYRLEEEIDADLQRIAEKHALVCEPRSPILTIRKKSTLSAAEQAMIALGMSEEDLMTQEERDADAAAKASLEAILDNVAVVENPFYTPEER